MRRMVKMVVGGLVVAVAAGCGASPVSHAGSPAGSGQGDTASAAAAARPGSTGLSGAGSASPAVTSSPSADPQSANTSSGGAASSGKAGSSGQSTSASPEMSALEHLPYLTVGAHGPAVRTLQRRLNALHYYAGRPDGGYGTDTLEAVWAFQEVQGLVPSPNGDVARAMRRALMHPRQPRVLVPRGGPTRVEVNLAHRYLVLYRNNKPILISHISPGGGYYYCSPGGGCGYAITPTGDYHTLGFLPGWVTVPLGAMYNPVFFIGRAYAIHGDTEVPLDPASHGCVRIPMDIAAFFHTMLPDTGTPVYIRG
jgi:peptidoglycan hydrolase-like protein with peptidoglycan-binding domain